MIVFTRSERQTEVIPTGLGVSVKSFVIVFNIKMVHGCLGFRLGFVDVFIALSFFAMFGAPRWKILRYLFGPALFRSLLSVGRRACGEADYYVHNH